MHKRATDCAIGPCARQTIYNTAHGRQRDRIEYPVQAYWGKVASLATFDTGIATDSATPCTNHGIPNAREKSLRVYNIPGIENILSIDS